ncbi:hypothetical protein [Actinoplanes sp. NPDC051494]|uniref:hypothetical protein n=1 Tax=Actinoplanes sp. NPDC051494 TaxID=3363907 RepID=UPI0037948812
MAFRTWARVLSATLGIAALAGAGELGMAYGLGIVRLTRVVDITARDQWTAQLAWVAWFPMVAAVVGAVAGSRLMRRWAPGFRGGVGTEIALSFAAAIGAAVVIPLTMQPARTAQVTGVDPVVVIAICTGLGALVGVFAAWGALAQAVARWSLAVTGIAVGVVALVSVSPSLAPSDPLPAVRLGVLDATSLSEQVLSRTALATMPALALLIGLALGWIARRRDLPTLTIALAGLPGPALLTVSYLIAGPGSGADRYQMTPYWAAMTATGAGVLGSVLAAVLRRNPAPDDDQLPPADDRPALPRRPDQNESAIAAAGAGTPTAAGPTAGPAGPASGPTAGTPGHPFGSPGHPSGLAGPAAGPAGAGTAGPGSGTATPPAATGQPLRPVDTAVFDLPRQESRRGQDNRQPHGAQSPGGRHGAHSAEAPGHFDGFSQGAHAQAPGQYVPEPATRPLPPEARQQPSSRPTGGPLGRNLRPAARSRGRATAEPMVPEPTAISAPLPQPEPLTPAQPSVPPRLSRPITTLEPHAAPTPRSTPGPNPAQGTHSAPGTSPATGNRPAPAGNRPAPAGNRAAQAGSSSDNPADTTPRLSLPIGEPVTDPRAGDQDAKDNGRGRFGLRRRKDEDYVDWVSGLGN